MPAGNEQQMHDAAHWCLRLGENDLTEQEWSDFEAWLELDDNADRFNEMAGIWRSIDEVGEHPRLISLRGAALAEFQKANRQRWTFGAGLGRGQWIGLVAATLCIVTMAGWFAFAPKTYETAIGERQIAMLEDGSTITLDANSSVDVRMKSTGRNIELEQGRAKFDVAKDSLRPFMVTAGDKTIVATGTSFSVELIGKEVRVILYEGEVEVHDRRTASAVTVTNAPNVAPIVMKPGSELIANLDDASETVVNEPDLADTLSWESGMLVFDNEPLYEAVERVNRYSGRQIRINNPSLAKIRVNGVFKAGDIDAFAEGISRLHHLKLRSKDGDISLDRG